MPTEVIFPRVDMDMNEGKIARWHVAEGAEVTKGLTLFEIETDKAAMEIEAPASGVLRQVLAGDGATVPVGQAVAFIYAAGEVVAEAAVAEAVMAAETEAPPTLIELPSAPIVSEIVVAPVAPPSGSVKATPLARRLARQNGVLLDAIIGSGALGRIHADDVRNARPALPLPVQPPHAPVSTIEPRPQGRAVPLHVEWQGPKSRSPAVFIHGFGSDLSIWKTTLQALGTNHSTVRLDLPAHGKSPLGNAENFEDVVVSVRETLLALDLEAVHLVGHSYGGVIAMALAAERRLPLKSLMLIAPAGLGPDIEREFLDGFTRATRVESLTPWLKLLFARSHLVTPAFARAIMQGRESETLRGQQRQIADTMFPDGTQAIDLRETLETLSIPAKVVWGRLDRIIPSSHSRELPGHIGLHLLNDTGHVPHLEQPALVARLIEELVRSAK
jgi:pimeloyl-ACP methyl ester carboxylesterase